MGVESQVMIDFTRAALDGILMQYTDAITSCHHDVMTWCNDAGAHLALLPHVPAAGRAARRRGRTEEVVGRAGIGYVAGPRCLPRCCCALLLRSTQEVVGRAGVAHVADAAARCRDLYVAR